MAGGGNGRGRTAGARSQHVRTADREDNAEQGTTDMHTSIEGRADFGPLFPRDLIEGGATIMASSAADIDLRSRQDPVEGAHWRRGVLELVRADEACRELEGRGSPVGSDSLPSRMDQQPLSRAAYRTVEAGRTRPAEGRDCRAHDDEAGTRRTGARATGGPKDRPPANAAGHRRAFASTLGAAAPNQREWRASPTTGRACSGRRSTRATRSSPSSKGRPTASPSRRHARLPSNRRMRVSIRCSCMRPSGLGKTHSAAGHRRRIAEAEPASASRLS